MTSQEAKPQPLVLKDELAKMTREASVGTWLKDAQVEIEAWRLGMPDAMRVQLYSTLRDDESLEVRASDGWGKTVGIALYSIEAGGVRFYPGNPELMPNITLGNEQAFISHLLQLLQKKFNLPQ